MPQQMMKVFLNKILFYTKFQCILELCDTKCSGTETSATGFRKKSTRWDGWIQKITFQKSFASTSTSPTRLSSTLKSQWLRLFLDWNSCFKILSGKSAIFPSSKGVQRESDSHQVGKLLQNIRRFHQRLPLDTQRCEWPRFIEDFTLKIIN